MVVGHCRKYKHKSNEATIGHIIIGMVTQLRGPDQFVMLSVQCIRMDQWEVFMWVRVKQLGLTLTLGANFKRRAVSGTILLWQCIYNCLYSISHSVSS